ncbi:MAG: hypothetical protein M0004_05895 [Actinomycetota bacterium]|nr:hypothetical protein [Actinomycetota bacterium]
MIALVAVLTVLLTGLSTGLVNSGISGLRALPLTDLAFQPKTNSTFSQSTLDAATIRSLGRQPGIQAEPLGLTFFNAKDAAGTSLSIALVGIEPGGFIAKGVAGGSQLGRTRTGVIVSRGVAAEGVRVGGRIRLDRSSVALHVVGIAPTATYGHVALVYAPIALWRQATYGQVTGGVLPASAQGLASAAALQVRPGIDVSAVRTHLGVDIVTKQQAYAGSPGYVAETATMSLIIDFLYVIAALIVGAFFTVWTIQRKADIGLLKALGASNGLVIRDALAEREDKASRQHEPIEQSFDGLSRARATAPAHLGVAQDRPPRANPDGWARRAQPMLARRTWAPKASACSGDEHELHPRRSVEPGHERETEPSLSAMKDARSELRHSQRHLPRRQSSLANRAERNGGVLPPLMPLYPHPARHRQSCPNGTGRRDVAREGDGDLRVAQTRRRRKEHKV